MQGSRETEIRQQNERIKKSGERFLKTFLLIFIGGYLFFFSSPLWMPDNYTGLEPTKINDTVTANERDVTLVSWIYSKEEKKLQAQFEIKNMSIDGFNQYEWGAVERNKGVIKTEVVLQTDDMAVINLLNVPRRWTEISLRMNIPASSEEEDEVTLKFYAVKNSVERVTHIKEKSSTEYMIFAAENKISVYRKEQRALKKDIEKQENSILSAKRTIKKLEADKKYQTADEQFETDERIMEINNEIRIFEAQIEKDASDIKQLQEKVKMQKQLLESLGG